MIKNHVLEHGNELITSRYGYRTVGGKSSFHHAVDLVSGLKGADGHKLADKIIAIESGKVSETGYDNVRGYYVRIAHNEHIVSHYQHLAKRSICVKQGQTVKKGQPIAVMGYTGDCYPKNSYAGRHLDFRIIIDGAWSDPLPYLMGEKSINETFKSFAVTPKAVWLNMRENPNGKETGKRFNFKEISDVKKISLDAQKREWFFVVGKSGQGYVAGWLCRKI